MKIGIIGAGQLGRMLALAGYPLGLQFRFLWSERSESCDGLGEFCISDLKNPNIKEFCSGIDVATYEFENLPVEAIQEISSKVALFPGAKALSVAQDRISEKNYFKSLNIPTPKFCKVDSSEDMKVALSELGLPFVLKTRSLGYDGKGQVIVRDAAALESYFNGLGAKNLIAEEFIKFDRELSVIGVRGKDGTVAVYPLFQNTHNEGILFKTEFPAEANDKISKQATDAVKLILEDLNYVGVLALELFEVSGTLFANEIAPRVHNSGHVTIDACQTSQFENHIRAITGLPLGSTKALHNATMFNLIGKVPQTRELAKIPGARLHLYGKSARAGRKLGHVTLIEPTAEAQSQLLKLITDHEP